MTRPEERAAPPSLSLPLGCAHHGDGAQRLGEARESRHPEARGGAWAARHAWRCIRRVGDASSATAAGASRRGRRRRDGDPRRGRSCWRRPRDAGRRAWGQRRGVESHPLRTSSGRAGHHGGAAAAVHRARSALRLHDDAHREQRHRARARCDPMRRRRGATGRGPRDRATGAPCVARCLQVWSASALLRGAAARHRRRARDNAAPCP